MKKLIERFQKFLKESGKEPIPLPDVGNVAMYHAKELDNHELILYIISQLPLTLNS